MGGKRKTSIRSFFKVETETICMPRNYQGKITLCGKFADITVKDSSAEP